MNIELKDIHLGKAIKARFDELELTKTEFGRRIGVPQQHINRIFERDTMETKRLMKICQALDFNFFALFCKFPTNVNAYLAAVALGEGDANNNIGDAALLAEVEIGKVKIAGLEKERDILSDQVKGLKDSIEQLKSNLRDKDHIINLVQNK